MEVDLRSDTVTKPSKPMLEAMLKADIGDDVYDEDTTTNQLQEYAATLFGVEAALFLPTGTMSNQIAIKIHTTPGSEVICHNSSHVYRYEAGGIAFHSQSSIALVNNTTGMMYCDAIENLINQHSIHFPITRLITIENTTNVTGGQCQEWDELIKIKALCEKHCLAYHLDGARLFNAIVEKQQSTTDYGRLFDTISICLSKGLGAPIGSILLGSKASIKQAKRYRKLFGGGMRQSGYMAACGLYALKNNISRLKQDHKRATYLAYLLSKNAIIDQVTLPQTNIVIAQIKPNIDIQKLIHQAQEKNIYFLAMNNNTLRMITHLNINDEQIQYCEDFLNQINQSTTSLNKK